MVDLGLLKVYYRFINCVYLGILWVDMRTVSTKLSLEEFNAVVERARRENTSVSAIIRKAILVYLGLPSVDKSQSTQGLPEIDQKLKLLHDKVNELTRRVSELEERLIALEKRIETPETTTTERRDTQNQSKETKESKDEKLSPNIFCKSKQKIYDLKLYIENLKQRDIKIKDFWEENDKYCFEVE